MGLLALAVQPGGRRVMALSTHPSLPPLSYKRVTPAIRDTERYWQDWRCLVSDTLRRAGYLCNRILHVLYVNCTGLLQCPEGTRQPPRSRTPGCRAAPT